MYIAELNQAFTPLKEPQGLPLNLLNALSVGGCLFTTLRSDAAHCWQRAHLKRLHTQTLHAGWSLPHFREFATWLEPTLEQAFSEAGVWRISLIPHLEGLQVFHQEMNSLPLPISVLIHKRGNLPIITQELPACQGGLHVQVYQHPSPAFKHSSQWGSLQLRKAVAPLGDDVLWQNAHGHLTECTHANWFCYHLEHGWLLPLAHEALAGITLQQVRKAFQQLSIPYTERAIVLSDVSRLLFAFTCNSGVGLKPMALINAEDSPYALVPYAQTLHDAEMLYKAWYDIAFAENTQCYS